MKLKKKKGRKQDKERTKVGIQYLQRENIQLSPHKRSTTEKSTRVDQKYVTFKVGVDIQ